MKSHETRRPLISAVRGLDRPTKTCPGRPARAGALGQEVTHRCNGRAGPRVRTCRAEHGQHSERSILPFVLLGPSPRGAAVPVLRLGVGGRGDLCVWHHCFPNLSSAPRKVNRTKSSAFNSVSCKEAYCGLIPALRASPAIRVISESTNLSNSAGAMGDASTPSAA